MSEHVILTADALRREVDHFMEHDAFAFDVETRNPAGMAERHRDPGKHPNALNPRVNEVFWISLATTGRAIVVPMGHRQGEIVGYKPAPLREGQKRTSLKVPVFSPPPVQIPRGEAMEILRPLFFTEGIRKIGHNVKFDLLSLEKYWGDIPARPFGDTMGVAHLLNENRSLRLIDLVKEHFNHAYEKIGKTIDAEPFNRAASYSYMDAKYTWLLWSKTYPMLAEWDLADLFEMEMDLMEVVCHMEKHGVPVNVAAVHDLDVALTQKMDEIEARLYQANGAPFLLTSPKERGEFIYDKRGHKPYIFTPKKKERSTAAAAFSKYVGDPLVASLIEWDDLHKLHATYVLNFKSWLHDDGRLHADFKPFGTVTGRFSCGEPNLQNIPRVDEDDPESAATKIRSLFWTADPDKVLIVGDYSQIELRVLAHYTKDPVLVKAFWEDQDIHQASADALGSTRSIAKNINFAIPFGAGPSKIAAMGRGAFDEATAVKFYRLHKERFTRVWGWINATKREPAKRRPAHVRTILGRTRLLPQVFVKCTAKCSDDCEEHRTIRARAERQAVNTKIQGSAADLIKKAMIRIYDGLAPYPEMHLVLTVHDELVVIAPKAQAELAVDIMREAMEGDEMQMLRVPVKANIGYATTWAEAK